MLGKAITTTQVIAITESLSQLPLKQFVSLKSIFIASNDCVNTVADIKFT